MIDLKTMYPAQVNSPYTTTLGEISTSDTAVVVADVSVLPAQVPFLLTLGYDKSASETVLVTAVSGNTLTIVRGVDGDALLWVAGTKAARIFTAKDLNDVQDNIATLNTGKQDNLTLDEEPIEGSGNPITSGGVKAALDEVDNALDEMGTVLEGKQDALTFDAEPTPGSTNPVASGGVSAALDRVVEKASQIGDIKTSFGPQDDSWLACNGNAVSEVDFPDLVPLLNAQKTFERQAPFRTESYPSSYSNYATGITRAGGTYFCVTNGYKYSSSASWLYYKPVLCYSSDPLNGWMQKELNTNNDQVFIQGVFYQSSQRRYYAYGYKFISYTECYPVIYHCYYSIGNSWNYLQLSETPGKVTGACMDGSTIYFIVPGVGTSSGTIRMFSGDNPTQLVESTLTFEGTGPTNAGVNSFTYGDGYWAFVDRMQSIWYTNDLTQRWKSNKLISSGVQLLCLCYGGGTWVCGGMQNSGGSGRIFYSDDITARFTDLGVTDPNDDNEFIAYSDGVFIIPAQHMATVMQLLVSTDQGRTWRKRPVSTGWYKGIVGYGTTWVMVGDWSSVSVFTHPEADATLPTLTADKGTVYIKGK